MPFKKTACLLLGASALFIFNSCEKSSTADPVSQEPEQEPTVYFSYRSNRQTQDTDNFVILHNEEGSVLDYRSFEKDELIEFISADIEVENLIVTEFSSRLIGVNKMHNLSSTSQGIGSHMEVDISGGITNEKIGSFELVLENIPDYIAISISNETRELSNSHSAEKQASTWTIDYGMLDLFEHNDYLISIQFSMNAVPKVYRLSDVQNGEAYRINYTELESLDTGHNIYLPQADEYTIRHQAMAKDEAYGSFVLQDLYISLSHLTEPLHVGVASMAGFDSYATTVNAYGKDRSLHYSHLGPLSSDITIPELDALSIIDGTFPVPQLDTELNYGSARHSFYQNSGQLDVDYEAVSWNVTLPQGLNPSQLELPAELTENYKGLAPADFNHSYSELYLNEKERIRFQDQ